MDIAQASHGAFETLVHARKKDVDPFKDVDPKTLLAFSLQRLSQAHPNKVRRCMMLLGFDLLTDMCFVAASFIQFGPLVHQSLTPEALNALQGYFVAAGLSQPYLG